MRRLCGLLLVAVILIAAREAVHACTGIQIKPRDGSIISGRTLEFGSNMQTDAIVVPRGLAYTGTAPGGKPGLKWTTKYAAAGANMLGMSQILDGVNEKGLGIGLFYFPGYASYQEVTDANASKALAPWEFGTYLLTTCASADEAVAAAKQVLVGATVFEQWKFVPPAHFVVHDASGQCYVLEFVDGQLNVHQNPLGVMSNSPTFDWHLTNLRNYVNLTVNNVPPVAVDKLKLEPFGQGSGLRGLPGDFTPPSRFIRAAVFSQSALPVDNAADGIRQAFHMLNQFDIPKGAVRGDDPASPEVDYTQWTSVSDLTNRRFFIRTYDNQTVRMIDLDKCDLDAAAAKIIPLAGHGTYEDMTPKAK